MELINFFCPFFLFPSIFQLTLFKLPLVNGQSHSEPCGVNGECDTSLICESGFCLCLNEGIDSKWDNPSRRCLIFPGSPCEFPQSGDSVECTPLANCLPVPGSGGGSCSCQKGLQMNSEKKCVHGYKQSCHVKNDLCDPLIFLKCGQENRCDCEIGLIYDKSRADPRCVLLPGNYMYYLKNSNYINIFLIEILYFFFV